MKRTWMGGVAALSLLAAASASAQIHGHQSGVSPTVGTSAPPPVSASAPAPPAAPTVSRAQAAKARYADCMSRYKDRKGCRYLVWRKRS